MNRQIFNVMSGQGKGSEEKRNRVNEKRVTGDMRSETPGKAPLYL